MFVSPQFYCYGRVLEDPISHKQEDLSYFPRERTDASKSIDFKSPSSKTPLNVNDGDFGNDGSLDGDNYKNVKKQLYHNASERDRRMKMNTLYDNLRSLLPPDHEQSKKMRIPATLSRVLKYIPELQKEVKRLTQKKESFMSKNSKAEEEKTDNHRSSNSAASAVQINEDEIVIQICKPKSKKGSLSEAILRLEDEGFLIKNVSCFESFEGRLFNNLHFQAQEGQVIDAEKLKEKVLSLI